MPRYSFNIYDGRDDTDATRMDLPDPSAARKEAQRFAGEAIRDAAVRADFLEEWRVEMTDDSGLVLIRMDFVTMTSPAIR